MATHKIKFKAWDVSSGKPDLEATLDLLNDSKIPDEIVIQGLREFLSTYTIGHNPKNKELDAICNNAVGGRRHVFILAHSGGNIWMVSSRKDAPRTLCESYHFNAICDEDMNFTSKDADYTIRLGRTP